MILLDYPYAEQKEILSEFRLPDYKIRQIYRWLVKGAEFSEMSDLSKEMREALSAKFVAQPVGIEKTFLSKDGTVKFLFRLTDQNLIEGVLMRYKYGNTLCVSTQVGCRMGCKFCASALGGRIRNLSSGEILGQIVAANRYLCGDLKNREITNVVLMGSGEPLDNFYEVCKFLDCVNDPEGLNISYRNISLSTCGLIPQIYRLAEKKMPLNLTISLHSAIQSKREALMPIAKNNPVWELKKAVMEYFQQTKRRIYLEYTLIDGVNDGKEDVLELIRFAKGMAAHVNLIRLNPVKESGLRPSAKTNEIRQMLNDNGVSATLRRQMGVDIEGACGQLRKRYLEKSEEN